MSKAYLNWSSGKDAALALYKVRNSGSFEISKLLTTINSEAGRISMHGVRKELLMKQSEMLGLPLKMVELAGNVSMEKYNRVMKEATGALLKEGYEVSVFGDIFLEDLKQYREAQLAKIGLKAEFPLWKTDTKTLINEFIEAGFRAIVVCVNTQKLDESFCGRIIDKDFLQDLPEDVDPCGENGEFHTFVFDGPLFKAPVKFKLGEKVKKSYAPHKKEEDNCFSDDDQSWDTEFCFCDLIPE
ncbi:Dph6-related ATP pyrophosphatase [Salegentibacter chungangensis]|uniref:Diphthine--ammonia ligase n=1 Tax=Salegentibacter chungangensis TaxID=1335724 RepID=A0ABW3NT36_9FLAO